MSKRKIAASELPMSADTLVAVNSTADEFMFTPPDADAADADAADVPPIHNPRGLPTGSLVRRWNMLIPEEHAVVNKFILCVVAAGKADQRGELKYVTHVTPNRSADGRREVMMKDAPVEHYARFGLEPPVEPEAQPRRQFTRRTVAAQSASTRPAVR